MQHVNINSNAGEALPTEDTEANILLISILSEWSEHCNAQEWTKTCSSNYATAIQLYHNEEEFMNKEISTWTHTELNGETVYPSENIWVTYLFKQLELDDSHTMFNSQHLWTYFKKMAHPHTMFP